MPSPETTPAPSRVTLHIARGRIDLRAVAVSPLALVFAAGARAATAAARTESSRVHAQVLAKPATTASNQSGGSFAPSQRAAGQLGRARIDLHAAAFAFERGAGFACAPREHEHAAEHLEHLLETA